LEFVLIEIIWIVGSALLFTLIIGLNVPTFLVFFLTES